MTNPLAHYNFFIILILLGVAIAPAYGMYADIPKSPEVHFTYHATKTVILYDEFNVTVHAQDDRSAYYKYFKSNPLQNANVTVYITSFDKNILMDSLTGKTNKYGYWSGGIEIGTPKYSTHGLYNATITIQHYDSIDTKHFQFWTILKH